MYLPCCFLVHCHLTICILRRAPPNPGPSEYPHPPSPNPAPLRPRIALPGTSSRELCTKPTYFRTRIFGPPQFSKIYANRSVLRGAVKTITDNNPWRNSGKARVQHVRSKGRAVLSLGFHRSGPRFH